MHLLEVYANSCGVKLDKNPVKPFSKFHPTPERYITVNPSSGMPSKNYDHYGLVLDFLAPFLGGIKIVQLGLPTDPLIPDCIDFRHLEFAQSVHVVKNALLHIGNDSVLGHIAGIFDVPECILFGPTYANVCKPYYHNEKSVFIESHRNGGKPTHQAVEFPKSINLIKPEEVAQAILGILGVEGQVKYKSAFIGCDFTNPVIEVVPDFDLGAAYGKTPTVVRMDLHHDENALVKILGSRKAGIVTSKPINPSILTRFKNNIAFIDYFVGDDCDVDFVKFLHGQFNVIDKGKNLSLYKVSTLLERDKLAQLKLKLFDYNCVRQKEMPEEPPEIRYKRLVTNSFVLSKGKAYASEWHLKNSKPLENGESDVPENPDRDFLSFINNFYIYEIV